MIRSRSLIAAACAATVLLLNCDDWPDWDDVFKRQPAANKRGWTGGDGAYAVKIPGGNSTLWLFGDSLVTGVNNGQRVMLPGGQGLFNVVFGNTIAVQSTLNPDPSQIKFYARKPPDSTCSNVRCLFPPCLPPCPVEEITNNLGNTSGHHAFFNHNVLGSFPSILYQDTVLWPGGAFCLNCAATPTTDDKLLLAFREIRFCNEQFPCEGGVEHLSNLLATVSNPTAPVAQWTFSPAPLRTSGSVLWGQAFLQEGSYVYIYGTKRMEPLPGFFFDDLFVARATPANVLNQGQWQYYKADGTWGALSNPSETTMRRVASDVGSLVSITKVVRRGYTRYLLVHTKEYRDHFLYPRVSNGNTFLDWPNLSSSSPRMDLEAMDSSVTDMVLGELNAGDCSAVNVNGVGDLRGCGATYHGLGHGHLSTSDDFGLANLLYSYVVPSGADGAENDARYYRPKFAQVPLDHLSPWCGASGTPCWAGIAHQFVARPIASGQQLVYAFGVRNAVGTTFHASITYGSGNPDLYVRFGSPPTTSTYACRSNSSGVGESCNLTVPTGQTVAYVMVRGAAAGSFSLRAHYRGN